MAQFVHLHCHSQFSLLDGATNIPAMIKKAKADGQPAVALTDHGNMFGCFDLVSRAREHGVRPILGCEFYLVENRHKRSFLKSAGERDERMHQLLLAKNQQGYENLSKLCSLGFLEGLYGKFPRIDKELIGQYHEGLIATSCCVGAEIPQAIIRGRLDEAEKKLRWWIDLFGEDYYIELQRHAGCENIDQTGVSQEQVNQTLLGFAKKYGLKVVATNDVHYLEESDWRPHDVLLCINTNSNPEDADRFQFTSNDYFFKTADQMEQNFRDVPHAVEQTVELAERCFDPVLERKILLPTFSVPESYASQDDYLEHLVFLGAAKRYGSLNPEVEQRIRFELSVIQKMEFAGYFLIVQDFILKAREKGVRVGPGRGSAVGSVVAYCLTITDIDPIRYNLLFERFLNPERISMPDIDIDFDDRGRQKVIDYVVEKYSRNQVAQIVTFGTMAAKMSIRDVARVRKLELPAADRLAKLVPNRPGITLRSIIGEDADVNGDFIPDDRKKIEELRSILKKGDLESEVLQMALKLEGSVRNTGVHASGIIIAPDDITRFVPVCTAKDTDLLVTQIEGGVIEKTGLLKMDFLGLKTLSIINDTLDNIAGRHGESARIDLDAIPLDDPQTLQLFQDGNTIGLFQFESEGMRGHLKNLRPSGIEDIIAMNALYRPGPMSYIDEFIERKYGRIPVEYPHPWLEDLLRPTYGIMVYQEQIMQAAQIMADYSLGDADILRRAMGKKKKEDMDKQSAIFLDRCRRKGIDEKKGQEIFDIMARFAAYGFNRSHAAAYSILAFQTAYLKTHYPAEFMAAVLTSNKANISDLSTYIRECHRMKLDVLGPDINESGLDFTVNEHGQIRFGLSAMKGVGEGPVLEIIGERKGRGPFSDFADLIKRLESKMVNKKVIESCVYAGAFDSFSNMHRAQYFAPYDKYPSFIEYMIRWGNHYHASQKNMQMSLFGDSLQNDIVVPSPPACPEWTVLEKLGKEIEIAGIYLSAHPLDQYRIELNHAPTLSIDLLSKLQEENKEGYRHRLCGIVTNALHRTDKRGEGYATFTLQDYYGSVDLRLPSRLYPQFKHLVENGQVIMVDGSYGKRKYDSEKFNDWEFYISSLAMLSDSLNQLFRRSIEVFVPLEMIGSELGDRMELLFKKNKGNLPVHIQVLDAINKLQLEMMSPRKVAVSSELLSQIENLGLGYKLN
ncbi:MAG: DNA polymerase III subunit alpha [Saprospiraceae bacterium]|nr:DNA polymerase III subunit alpha [Saprospiraceae bacterium]MBP9210715.1 DNA polymerase III subunit alpha [Saprospiraceae bacterium]